MQEENVTECTEKKTPIEPIQEENTQEEKLSKPQKEEAPAETSKEEKLNKKQLGFLLGVYFVILLWFVLFKCNDNESLCPEFQTQKTLWEHFLYGLIPFQHFSMVLEDGMELVVFIANFILFIPMGILLPFFMSKKKSILVVFVVALGIEVIQLFTGWGGFDITDVIITFLGGPLGVWLHKLLRPIVTDKVVNKISFWLSAICFPIAVFAIVNTALHFPPNYAARS